MSRPARSSLQRLRAMPAVVTLPMLVRETGWSRAMASVYVARWVATGLIARAGPRAGIYYNLSALGAVTPAMRIEAVLSKYPSAIAMGPSVLHAEGWISQIPQRIHVAVLTRPSLAGLDGFEIHRRPRAWFVQAAAARAADCPELYGLKAVPPLFALRDMYASPECWHPDPDDLDLPDDVQDLFDQT